MSLWVVLSEKQVETINQSDLPVLQTRGKDTSLFPLYIQCRSHEDAEEVRRIHEPLLNLYRTSSSAKTLAHAIHGSLDCSAIMNQVHPFYALLNGRTFRGILHSASDFDAQTQDFGYPSWRRAESFEDALLIMVHKGDKKQATAIRARSPSISSVATDLDHLTVSSVSSQNDDRFITSPPISACGKKSTQYIGMFPSKPGQSSKSPGSPEQHKFGFGTPPTFTQYSQWPRSPPQLPGNGCSAKPVYKYIRNVVGTVGTITDRAGVLSHITTEDYRVLGDIRAAYLDSHGYGAVEVMKIVSAFEAASVEEFVSRAEGCGMSILELEWFWALV